MKKFRIRYTILDGECEYGDDFVIRTESMDDRKALSEVFMSYSSFEAYEDFDYAAFAREYHDETHAWLPDGRAVKDVCFEEIRPILFVVNDHGVRCQTWPLPDDVIIRIEHYDADGCHLGTETWGL